MPRGERVALLHLVLLSGVLAAAVFAYGGTLPSVWLACEVAVGLLVAALAISGNRPSGSGRASSFGVGRAQADGFPKGVLLLPLYAFLQVIPLPPGLVEALSPARVALQRAVVVLSSDVPSWTPISVYPGRTLEFAIRLAAYAGVFWMARYLSIRLSRYAFAVAAPIVAVAAVEAAIALLESNAAGASASYVNRNHLSGLLEMALPFALAAAFLGLQHAQSRVAARGALAMMGAGFCACVIFAGILATRSRAGLVAALASLLVMGLGLVARACGTTRQRLAGAILVPVLLGAAFVYFPSDHLVRRYAALSAAGGVLREGRIGLWRETLDLIAAYPIAGCGFGAYEAAFLRYKRSAPMVNDSHAHNEYLELLAEAGIVGFALCVVLAARPVSTVVRAALSTGWRGVSSRGPNPLGPTSHGANSLRPGSQSTDSRKAGSPRADSRKADSRQSSPLGSSALALACAGSMTAILAHSLVDFNLRIPANGMVFFWVLGICAAWRDSALRKTEGVE
ncbi:MAG: O-antigen ligase family protein [Bryobacterales bacterium]